MAMPNVEQILLPSDDNQVNAIVGNGKVVNASDMVMAYSFDRDAGAAFTGVLEGSAGGIVWTQIATLAASGEGVIPEQYMMVRARITVGGAIGANTLLRYHGKS